MLFYSLNWIKKKNSSPKNLNRITIEISGVNSFGQTVLLEKEYDEWLGVCTNNINKTISEIKYFFPGINIISKLLNCRKFKKVFPDFKKKLLEKEIVPPKKSFFKLYSTNAYIYDIGLVLDKYKISYYRPEEWLDRLFIDLCAQKDTQSFYHEWYNVGDSEMLLESMQLNIIYKEDPPINIISFHVETGNENKIETTDKDQLESVVMIGMLQRIYNSEAVEKCVLYVTPLKNEINNKLKQSPDVTYFEYLDEKELLKSFHQKIILSNILIVFNNEDIPHLFSRVILLNMKKEIEIYSSKKFNDYTLTTMHKKIVLDILYFLQRFSKFNLTSDQLKDIANYKLKISQRYYNIKSSTLSYYYCNPAVTTDILLSSDKKAVFDFLKPSHLKFSEFGTFLDCLNACIENATLIYLLFNHEFVLTFLIERANITSINIEMALYMSDAQYILKIFNTVGTLSGFFLNTNYFHNSVEKDLENYKPFLIRKKKNSYTFQGGFNFAIPGTFYKNVTVLDFLSFFPSIVVNENLSYETSGLIDIDTFLNLPDDIKKKCIAIPYTNHSENDLSNECFHSSNVYAPIKIDATKHELVIVAFKNEIGFLPSIIKQFLKKRNFIKKQYKMTENNSFYVKQLNYKLLLNSICGLLACKKFSLACVAQAMIINCLARNYLLAAAHFVQTHGGTIIYSDTDSIFVWNFPFQNCHSINCYLNTKWVSLQMEKNMHSVFIISKKRYLYREQNKKDCAGVGFQRNGNEWVINYITSEVIRALENDDRDSSQGWLVWVKLLTYTFFKCRTAKKPLCLASKTKNSNEIVQTNSKEFRKESVHFEELLLSEKNFLIKILNMVFFKINNCITVCNLIINTMKWKELLNLDFIASKKLKKPIMILVLKCVKYDFQLNIHLT